MKMKAIESFANAKAKALFNTIASVANDRIKYVFYNPEIIGMYCILS